MNERPFRWRASGCIVLVRRNGFGVFISLKCRGLWIEGKRYKQFGFVLGYCTAEPLAQRLERTLRSGDFATLWGHFERVTRKVNPLVARQWDFIVTGGRTHFFTRWRLRLCSAP